jgi:hypothetical protein
VLLQAHNYYLLLGTMKKSSVCHDEHTIQMGRDLYRLDIDTVKANDSSSNVTVTTENMWPLYSYVVQNL